MWRLVLRMAFGWVPVLLGRLLERRVVLEVRIRLDLPGWLEEAWRERE